MIKEHSFRKVLGVNFAIPNRLDNLGTLAILESFLDEELDHFAVKKNELQ
jgi:hypothetical protein